MTIKKKDMNPRKLESFTSFSTFAFHYKETQNGNYRQCSLAVIYTRKAN